MKYLITLTTLTLSLGALAETAKPSLEAQQLSKANASLEQIAALMKEARVPQKNPLLLCYAGDKAYSEGAKFEQRVCARQAADVLENVRQRPLVWR